MLVLEGEIWVNHDRIIPHGRIIVEAGKIVDVGEGLPVPIGADHIIFDQGEKILPGFVEPHSHLGIYEEITGADRLNIKEKIISTELVASDMVNFDNIGLYEAALTGGVTTACVLPGSACLVGGIGSVVKTAGSREVLKREACLKLALGENVEKAHEISREDLKRLLKDFFGENKTRFEGFPVRVHCHRDEDIMTALELKKMFGLDMILEHLTEGHRCLDEIKEAGVKAVTGPFFVGRPKLEMSRPDRRLTTYLLEKGVDVSFMTDYPSNPPEMLKTALLEVIKYGVPEMKAFEMITMGSARMLGVEGQVGSLEPGKDGDIVVHSHSPFDYMDKVLQVYEKGVRVTWPDI